MEIHAFDPERRTNAQLMRDCCLLDYLPGPVLDLTYGKGNFWALLPKLKIVSNDLDPAKETDHSEDFTHTKWKSYRWPTVVLDPPYRLGGTPSTPDFDDAYGLDEYRTRAEVKEMIEAGTREACRIAEKFVLIKVQDHQSSGSLQPLTSWVINAAPPDVKLLDSLHVVGGRGQPNGRKQKTSRHAYSTLLVFTKKPPHRRS